MFSRRSIIKSLASFPFFTIKIFGQENFDSSCNKEEMLKTINQKVSEEDKEFCKKLEQSISCKMNPGSDGFSGQGCVRGDRFSHSGYKTEYMIKGERPNGGYIYDVFKGERASVYWPKHENGYFMGMGEEHEIMRPNDDYEITQQSSPKIYIPTFLYTMNYNFHCQSCIKCESKTIALKFLIWENIIRGRMPKNKRGVIIVRQDITVIPCEPKKAIIFMETGYASGVKL